MNAEALTLAFAGTPAIAAHILQALIDSHHTVARVYTRPDRKSGRGKKLQASAVKELALRHDLPLIQPATAVDIDTATLGQADLLIVVAFGMLLPENVLRAPGLGCLNVHMSLLPRWRGAAPIQRAIQAGDTETGVSIMQMDTGLDTGPVLTRARCAIGPEDTAASLHDRLAQLGSETLLEALDGIQDNTLTATPQDETGASYAAKISKAEARLDWTQPAIELARTIRAFNPAPVCHTELNGLPLRVWAAEALARNAGGAPGTVLAENPDAIEVVTGAGVLRLLTVQSPGKKPQPVAEFLRGRPEFIQNAGN